MTVVGIGRFESSGRRCFVCKCDCGNIKHLEPIHWERGIVKSCGCMHDELNRISSTKHGHSGDRLYIVYRGIVERCNNKNNPNYHNYGGRGIKICDEWLGKEGTYNFIKWAIKNGWKEYDDITIQTVDRIDPNGDYCPENCRLATMKEQAINKRNTVKIIYNGVEKPLSIFCKEFNIPYGYAYGRIKGKGMSAKSVLEEYNNKKWEN